MDVKRWMTLGLVIVFRVWWLSAVCCRYEMVGVLGLVMVRVFLCLFMLVVGRRCLFDWLCGCFGLVGSSMWRWQILYDEEFSVLRAVYFGFVFY